MLIKQLTQLDLLFVSRDLYKFLSLNVNSFAKPHLLTLMHYALKKMKLHWPLFFLSPLFAHRQTTLTFPFLDVIHINYFRILLPIKRVLHWLLLSDAVLPYR